MKRESLAVLAVLATSVAAPAQAAPVQWTVGVGANGHWYELILPAVDFAMARASALAMTHLGESGYLATVTSAAEQAFLNTFVNPGRITAWLGGSDAETEGVWKWLDGPEAGQVFTYTNWNAGEPNNVGNEDYLHGWFGAGGWNDIPGTLNYSYVVEYNARAPVAAIPVPAALPLLAAALGALGVAARRRKAT